MTQQKVVGGSGVKSYSSRLSTKNKFWVHPHFPPPLHLLPAPHPAPTQQPSHMPLELPR
jgi:hypothetical protein